MNKKAEKMLYVLCAASLVLPWFTYSGTIMGYCWGAEFYVYFLIPMLLTGYSLFGRDAGTVSKVAGMIGCCGNICALIYALGIWPELHNIRSGFRILEGIHTATVWFWVAAMLYIRLFIAVFASAVRSWTQKEDIPYAR